MSKKFLFLNLSVLAVSFGIQFYLSLRSYSLKADAAIVNWCPAGGSNWNCDQALTSDFSEVFGIAVSNFGMALNLICFLLIFLLYFGVLDRLWRAWMGVLALTGALASVVMFVISWVFLKSFCALCAVCYVLSFLFLFLVRKFFPSAYLFDHPFEKIKNMSLKDLKPPAFLFAGMILLAVLFHVWNLQMYPANTSLADSNFQDWKGGSPLLSSSDFEKMGSLSKGSKNSPLVVTEFSDMLCPYCARVYFVLKNFQESSKNVRVNYMHFPLDPRGCDKDSKPKSVSASCLLAKAVWCAEKEGKGLEFQDLIFKTQSDWISLRSRLSDLKSKIQKQAEPLVGDTRSFQECLHSSSAAEGISQHLSLGKRIELKGTPALFVNGKTLRPISVRLALEKIQDFIEKKEDDS